jgi:hypothetical protein
LATDQLRPGSSALSLTISERQAFLSEFLAEYAIIFLPVIDNVLLRSIDPSGKDSDEELKLQGIHVGKLTLHRGAGDRLGTMKLTCSISWV